MSKLQELINALEKDDTRARSSKAKAKRICVICSKSVTHFKKSSAWLEYNLSCICESCQDYYLSE